MKNFQKTLTLLALGSVYLCTSPIYSQELLQIRHSCSFNGVEEGKEYYVDQPSNEASQIVAKVMQMIVLPQNFIIKTANCKNALAATGNNERYILYNTSFLENFKKESNTQWAAYCVLAHEIGHHLSNHNLGEISLQQRKIQEIQPDKFAGGIMYRLGAALEQAQAGIHTFSLEGDTADSHPPKSARLEAVATGWKQAKELSPKPELIPEEDEVLAAKRKILREGNPGISSFEILLANFKFNNNKSTSELEAKQILRFLGVPEPIQSVFYENHYQVWGTLPTNNEVRIWTNTYSQDGPNCYALRFQTSNLRNYIGVNETYIRICKP